MFIKVTGKNLKMLVNLNRIDAFVRKPDGTTTIVYSDQEEAPIQESLEKIDDLIQKSFNSLKKWNHLIDTD